MAHPETSVVSFFLNGEKVSIQAPPATLRLIDYLHLPEVLLTGSKKGCGQGGCGACTVVVSAWDVKNQTSRHKSINSCLCPIAALHGLAVTTIEGTGSVTTEMNSVAFSLAKNNGSQCGYCSPGWVMNMTAYLSANGTRKPAKQEIEDIFDGNLCRCTGYRPILDAMKTYASNWTEADQANLMQCLIDPAFQPNGVDTEPKLALPKAPWGAEELLNYASDGYIWRSPATLDALIAEIAELGGNNNLRLICGNTSVGVYDIDVEDPKNLIDINAISELKQMNDDGEHLTIGGGISYTEFIDYLAQKIAANDPALVRNFQAIHYMARRTAGTIVRNSASIAGNGMLVFKHIHAGEPFPSDVITACMAAGVTMDVFAPGWDCAHAMSINDFINATIQDASYPYDKVITAYHIPYNAANDYIQCQKVARREINSHSIVNSGIHLTMGTDLRVVAARVILGGIATHPYHATNTETALQKYGLSFKHLPQILAAVHADVTAAYVPGKTNAGITHDYKQQLAESFVYKTMIHVLNQCESTQVPEQDRSAGEITWGTWGVSGGQQTYDSEFYRWPVSEPFIKNEAFLQASGETTYVHDYTMPPKALYGAVVTSLRALSGFEFVAGNAGGPAINTKTLEAHLEQKFPAAFRNLITVVDVPKGGTNMVGMGGDQTVYADTTVFHWGQAVAVVIAVNDVAAVNIARYVTNSCVRYVPVPVDSPLHNLPAMLGIDEAAAGGQIFPDYPEKAPFVSHIWQLERAGAEMNWLGSSTAPIPSCIDVQDVRVDNNACRLVRARQETGDQIHFYMETQAAAAFPNKDGSMRLHPSSQSPMDVHATVSRVLGLPLNKVVVAVPYVGGGYGGKTTQSVLVASMAAIAANKTGVPVRIVLQRAEDSALIGHRHAYQCDYQIAIDTGESNAANKGLLRGWNGNFLGDGGGSYDCSFVVGDCLQLRLDSAYFVQNYKSRLDDFNRKNKWLKRSISIVPVKYASGYNLAMLEQTSALVSIYSDDGTVMVRQGGVDMGQGILTQISQIAAYELNVPLSTIHVEGADTSVVPNPASTGASTGTQYNGFAVREACRALRRRLQDYANEKRIDNGEDWCKKQAIDYWNYGTGPCGRLVGWRHVDNGRSIWQNIIRMAFGDRVNLQAQYQAIIPGGTTPSTNLRFKTTAENKAIPGIPVQTENVNPEASDHFLGFTYNVAVSAVEIDILTGETTLLRSDIFYDMGKSLNPAIDIGQIEGAFVQGIGYVLMEETLYQNDKSKDDYGQLNTLNTWAYKIPATTTIPKQMNVTLFPRELAAEVPEEPGLLFSSKEVGEPPLVLAASVFMAVKGAIRTSRMERGLTSLFALKCPATVQEVRKAAEVCFD